MAFLVQHLHPSVMTTLTSFETCLIFVTAWPLQGFVLQLQ